MFCVRAFFIKYVYYDKFNFLNQKNLTRNLIKDYTDSILPVQIFKILKLIFWKLLNFKGRKNFSNNTG